MPYGRGLTARGIRSLYVGALRAAEVDDGGGDTVWYSVVAQCMLPQPIDWPATSAPQCCHCALVGLTR